MDSEDSRPGSSASNSSSSSSQTSRQSPSNDNEQNHENENQSRSGGASPASSSESRRSRRSGSIYQGSQNSRSKSKFGSDSSSCTSLSDENEDEESKSSNNVNIEKKSSPVCSENGKVVDEIRNLSTSPVPTSRRSSIDSSLSSNRSRSISAEPQQEQPELNINHEDLSDVSDLESEKRSSLYKLKTSVSDEHLVDEKDGASINDDDTEKSVTDLRQKLEKKKHQSNEKVESSPIDDEKILAKGKKEESLEDLVKADDEDALDFEAEEGECQESSKNDEKKEGEKDNNMSEQKNNLTVNDKNGKADEELEEGEVTDEDEKRPEETEPKPVCRFYTRGQCTWGMSCRFLHPGVTDKGNYTMFDLVRPVPLPQSGSTVGNRSSNYSMHAADFHDYRSERPVIHHRTPSLHHNAAVYAASHEARKVAPLDGPVVVESAWERGLRTAKEMMRKANKRKEQDMDFEDKKMNLTLSPDELEKDPYYLKDRLSPAETPRHPIYEAAAEVYNASERYGRAPQLPHYDEIDPYGRSARYRELPPHRMPQYEDERRVRPAREVIVQRVEPLGRSDDWNDPWMRSKSPNGRGGSREHIEKRRRERRSYSSNSSYSSSSSSQSETSSESSSLSPRDRHRRRYNSSSHKLSPSATRRASGRNMRSLTPPPRKPRGPSSLRQSPNLKRRTNIPSPVYNRGSAYSPVHKRKRLSPLTKKTRSDKAKLKHRHSTSSSDSDSTGSDSESDTGSSSSESSSQSQDRTPPKRLRISDKLLSNDRKAIKKDVPKKRSPISIELKKPMTVGVSALTSPPSHAAPIEKDAKKSRREELLKQLRAVEDAIAKKRSKLS